MVKFSSGFLVYWDCLEFVGIVWDLSEGLSVHKAHGDAGLVYLVGHGQSNANAFALAPASQFQRS